MQIFLTFVKAFVVGGLLCVIAQVIIDKTKLTPARILTLYVVLGVVLTAFGFYEPLVEYAGAGATVPLTGFGYNLAKGVEKAIAKDGALGILSGGLTAAAAGVSAAVVFSFLIGLIFSPKRKK